MCFLPKLDLFKVAINDSKQKRVSFLIIQYVSLGLEGREERVDKSFQNSAELKSSVAF